ncbi:MAG: FlhB-like flagellar biosynthesis protein [Campylobacterota bacterium]|nr:FlhB-like flagellar biosynthesis protein [Campylobacterota bacterium]
METKNKDFIQKAVALSYDDQSNSAPKVVASGKGEIAKNIIKIAQDNDLPIRKDEDLVELLSKLDIDKEIPPNMYKAVAEIFSFIYDITNKHKEKEQ